MFTPSISLAANSGTRRQLRFAVPHDRLDPWIGFTGGLSDGRELYYNNISMQWGDPSVQAGQSERQKEMGSPWTLAATVTGHLSAALHMHNLSCPMPQYRAPRHWGRGQIPPGDQWVVCLACRSFGWSACWSVAWLVGWSVGRLVGWSVGR